MQWMDEYDLPFGENRPRRNEMDWIERWLGLSPDGGDGSLEILLAVAFAVVGGALLAAALPATRRRVRELIRGT
jgi:hypothetical protein